jgi:hypothetical protein
VSQRRLLASAVSIAGAIAFLPGAAHAADSAHALHAGSASAGSALTSALNAGKTFNSPAGKSVREQRTGTAAAHTGIKSHAVPATGTTIYAATNGCSSETGNGTQGSPYCLVQDAVNAASPGDTIDVAGYTGSMSRETVTVSTSDLTIVGTSTQSWIESLNGTPALVLDHVTGVTVSNLMLSSWGGTAVQVIGSSDVTLDSDFVNEIFQSSASTVTVDGASSGVTLSRSYVDTGTWTAGSVGVSIASGASNVTLAGDALADTWVRATDVNGLNVVGNTIQRDCNGGIDVEGSSTGVSIEDNVVEDANPKTDGSGGGQAACTSGGNGWAPDITVASGSAAATTADYNDFYFYGTDATAAYNWSGASYPTLAAFQAAVPQGAHDTLDTVESKTILLRTNTGGTLDLILQPGSAAIGSANTSAPGRLTSDFFGTSPYTSRGAAELLGSDPTLAVALSADQVSAHGISATATITAADTSLTTTIAWGDGATETDPSAGPGSVGSEHFYTNPGTYTITVTVVDFDNNTVSNSVQVITAGADYTPDGPTRILDTRLGTGAPKAQLTSAAPIKLTVAGAGGVPDDATAVALNLTLTDSTGGGNVAAFPDGTAEQTSNLNYSAGQTVANLAIVPIGDNGQIDLAKQGPGAVDMIADVEGYFTQSASSGYKASASGPTRILDTRYGTGAPKKPLTSATPIKLKIAGAGGVPSGVTAVSLNLTLTNTGGGGDVIAYPDGSPQPTASNINYTGNTTIANAAVVPVGADGYIDLVKQGGGNVDVIADVEGYFTPGGAGAYLPIIPDRVFDSRDPTTPGKLPAQFFYRLPIDQETNGQTIPGVTTWVLNTTVTNVSGTGFVTVFPDNQNGPQSSTLIPNASNLNFAAGATVPNLTFAAPGADGDIDFFNGALKSSLDLIVDAFGAFQEG